MTFAETIHVGTQVEVPAARKVKGERLWGRGVVVELNDQYRMAKVGLDDGHIVHVPYGLLSEPK